MTPSPTPPTPTPTATPTRTPAPIVIPTPTPTVQEPSEPLDPGESTGAVLGVSTDVKICKKVMTPKGRALEKVRRHAGQTVRFRLRVTNLGTSPAHNVRVCDLLPRQMTLLSATAKPFFVRGKPCWRLPILKGQRQGFITVRISRTARGVVRNAAAVRSRAGGRRVNHARVRVLPARSRGGGVTG